MINLIRGARPIQSSEVKNHYNQFLYNDISLDEYTDIWRNWLVYTDHKSLLGLENFKYAHYTQGTSQTFDQFVLRNAKDRCIFAMRGEFQYQACISKFLEFEYIEQDFYTTKFFGTDLAALIISAPFSDFGSIHPEFDNIMTKCIMFNVPVCLDLAYWGIAKNIHLDLNKYPCIKEVTCSLSKPFFALENHRVGIRFTKEYTDDGISMLNEVNMQNKYSMSLGAHFMKRFSPDWNWKTYRDRYEQVCYEKDLVYTDTVIFGLGGEEYKHFNRGVPNNNRVCISEYLGDTDI